MEDFKLNKQPTPTCKLAVTCLSDKMKSVLYSLLAKRLLDWNQYNKIVQVSRTNEEVLKHLLAEMMKGQSPIFEKFCNVLMQKSLAIVQPSKATKKAASSEGDSGRLAAAADLERRPRDQELYELSAKLPSWWKQLARLLNVPQRKINRISAGHEYKTRKGREALLTLEFWREENASLGSVKWLCRVLVIEDFAEIAAGAFNLSNAPLDDAIRSTHEVSPETIYRKALVSCSVPVSRYPLRTEPSESSDSGYENPVAMRNHPITELRKHFAIGWDAPFATANVQFVTPNVQFATDSKRVKVASEKCLLQTILPQTSPELFARRKRHLRNICAPTFDRRFRWSLHRESVNESREFF
eukprot:m.91657 g.91657  ORF g.91657 m.91657 type:complete len:355 (+) comp36702_c0_seq1:435-1499(+)